MRVEDAGRECHSALSRSRWKINKQLTLMRILGFEIMRGRRMDAIIRGAAFSARLWQLFTLVCTMRNLQKRVFVRDSRVSKVEKTRLWETQRQVDTLIDELEYDVKKEFYDEGILQ